MNGGDGNQAINTQKYGTTKAVVKALNSVSDFPGC